MGSYLVDGGKVFTDPLLPISVEKILESKYQLEGIIAKSCYCIPVDERYQEFAEVEFNQLLTRQEKSFLSIEFFVPELHRLEESNIWRLSGYKEIKEFLDAFKNPIENPHKIEGREIICYSGGNYPIAIAPYETIRYK